MNSTFCIRTIYIFCKCYKVCSFPLHTTITLQHVPSLPLHTTCKFSSYFVNKLCWNNTDLGIEGSMAPSHFAETTQQSPLSIQRAYNTLYITGSSHTLHLVYFVFSHTSTNLSIGGSMAALTLFVLGHTQQRWLQSTHTLTCNRTSDSTYIQPKSTT